MRPDLNQLENEITPLLEVHGVELVALDWLQGPGHGILRLTVDNPGGDPRIQDPSTSISLIQVTGVTRDVSTAMDALDLIEGAYTLEVGSPGTERPLQKRSDYDRFAGLKARIEAREERGVGKGSFTGVLRGTVEQPGGSFAIRIDAGGREHTVPIARVLRAKLLEIKVAPKAKPGKGPSKRAERLAQREKARAINATKRAGLQPDAAGDAPTQNPDFIPGLTRVPGRPDANPTLSQNDNDTQLDMSKTSPADVPREAKR